MHAVCVYSGHKFQKSISLFPPRARAENPGYDENPSLKARGDFSHPARGGEALRLAVAPICTIVIFHRTRQRPDMRNPTTVFFFLLLCVCVCV